eukprot:m.45218 g.45218  ORF g.45218 m.45218 type:complete len:462 (-) comp10212_c0_seq2:106-1491(-)
MLLLTAILPLLAKQNAKEIVEPSWEFVPSRQGAECLNASATSNNNNTRWVHYALPDGKPPADGWPLFITFEVKNFLPDPSLPNSNETCGGAFDTQCINNITQACNATRGNETKCFYCSYDFLKNPAYGCEERDKEFAYEFCGGHKYGKIWHLATTPNASLAPCFFANGTFDHTVCQFEQEAGVLWHQRLKQYLLANGVAVMAVNPYEGDTWDCFGNEYWDQGLDKPFLLKLFKELESGEFGKLGKVMNTKALIPHGWSVGAHMVSQLIQASFSTNFANINIASGIFFSGASHRCYNFPPLALNQCSSCNSSQLCDTIGCSNHFVNQSQICCNYCCPESYTEDYFAQNPHEYSAHPPSFLVQMGTYDINADLCATRNYYQALQNHNVSSELHLIESEAARCYCVGDPSDATAKGSPYLPYCKTIPVPVGPTTKHPLNLTCLDHVMGTSMTLLPALNFILKYI